MFLEKRASKFNYLAWKHILLHRTFGGTLNHQSMLHMTQTSSILEQMPMLCHINIFLQQKMKVTMTGKLWFWSWMTASINFIGVYSLSCWFHTQCEDDNYRRNLQGRCWHVTYHTFRIVRYHGKWKSISCWSTFCTV